MEVLYSEKATKYLRKLVKTNKKLAQHMMAEIEAYAEHPGGHFDVKVLKGKFGSFKRLRVGDYRIIFDEELDMMHIYDIQHRREVYR